jgi:hypothetical protein
MRSMGDAIKTLSTGKSGEEVNVGHYKTAKDVDAVRRILYRCKKEFTKSNYHTLDASPVSPQHGA